MSVHTEFVISLKCFKYLKQCNEASIDTEFKILNRQHTLVQS